MYAGKKAAIHARGQGSYVSRGAIKCGKTAASRAYQYRISYEKKEFRAGLADEFSIFRETVREQDASRCFRDPASRVIHQRTPMFTRI